MNNENPNAETPTENSPEPMVIKSEVVPPSLPEEKIAEKEDELKPRLERLGGEPAPDITPEEFARLQQSGQIHIDPRGRVRSTTTEEADAGVSLRKRRAWYG